MPIGMSTPNSDTATTRKPSLKERQRQMREDAILDAAEEQLLTKGLAAMTLDDLIAEVGISKPTLYQHFRSKEELVSSIMTRELREAARKLHELAAAMPPGQALRALIEWFVEQRAQNDCGPVTDLCITLSLMAQGPIREAERAFTHEIELLVEAAQKEGSVRTSVPSIFVSQTLLSISKDCSYRDMLSSGRTNTEDMKQAVVRMLLGD
jgi:AcrR family transcriptional regulator